jgi:hypothetical protein
LADYHPVALGYNQIARHAMAVDHNRWSPPPVCFGLRISGLVEEDLLSETLSIVARRHSALGIFYPSDSPNGLGASIPADEIQWPFHVVNARGDASKYAAALDAIYRPFNLKDPPLMRATLIRQSDEESVLALAIDHINFDGESITALSQDICHVWQELSAGAEAEALAALTDPYESFVRYQRKWVGLNGETAFGFWAPQWRECGLYPRPPVPHHADSTTSKPEGRIWERTVSLAHIEQRARQLNAGHFSPFVLMVTALFKIIGTRYREEASGFVFYTSNRLKPEFRHGVGYYSNRLLLKSRPYHSASFCDAASDVRANTISALKYGLFPYCLITERLFPGEHASPASRQHLFVAMKKHDQAYAVQGAHVSIVDIDRPNDILSYPNLSVICTINSRDGTVLLTCSYGSHLYEDATVDSFMSDVVDTITDDRE